MQPMAKPAPAPTPVPADKPANIVKHPGGLLPTTGSQPAIEGVVDDAGLPEAVSLAANDVAKARAEREAKKEMKDPHPQDVVATPAPAPATKKPEVGGLVKHKQPKRVEGSTLPERVESDAEAEHNRPTEAEKEQGSMTGKLILPSGDKPKPESAQPKAEKPKKLAPGEVFVDEKGNVLVGE
jgi:hypothetical protein